MYNYEQLAYNYTILCSFKYKAGASKPLKNRKEGHSKF